MANTKHHLTHPRTRRILARSDFLELQERGRKLRSASLLLIYRLRDRGEPRLGVTITKKIDKRAVVRNRIRRRLKEQFRHSRPDFSATGDFVLIALAGATERSFNELKLEFITLFKRAKVL